MIEILIGVVLLRVVLLLLITRVWFWETTSGVVEQRAIRSPTETAYVRSDG